MLGLTNSAINFSDVEEEGVERTTFAEERTRELFSHVELFFAREGRAPKISELYPLLSFPDREARIYVSNLVKRGFLVQRVDRTLVLTNKRLEEL